MSKLEISSAGEPPLVRGRLKVWLDEFCASGTGAEVGNYPDVFQASFSVLAKAPRGWPKRARAALAGKCPCNIQLMLWMHESIPLSYPLVRLVDKTREPWLRDEPLARVSHCQPGLPRPPSAMVPASNFTPLRPLPCSPSSRFFGYGASPANFAIRSALS